MPYNAPSPATIPYSANTVDGSYTVALPDEPDAKPTLEQQFDDAVWHIEKIDREIKELRTSREHYLEKAHAARAALIEKCDSVNSLLDKKTVQPNY